MKDGQFILTHRWPKTCVATAGPLCFLKCKAVPEPVERNDRRAMNAERERAIAIAKRVRTKLPTWTRLAGWFRHRHGPRMKLPATPVRRVDLQGFDKELFDIESSRSSSNSKKKVKSLNFT